MNNQQRLEEIKQRLEMLNVLNNKMDTIISMLSDKNKSCEPMTTFVKANANADDTELKSYEMEIFQRLDNQRRNKNDM